MSRVAFQSLNPAEEQWVESQIQAAKAFVSEYSPSDAWDPIRLEALDRAFAS
jgi:hypothetical protein